MTRVLITGISGFIGGAAAKRLVDSGVRVTGLDVDPIPSFSLAASAYEEGLIEFHRCDIRDRAELEPIVRNVDAIIHLAAFTGVVPSVNDPSMAFDVNCTGTLRLLEVARTSEISTFIFASTGGALAGEVAPPISEDIVPKPLSPYGATKLFGEGMMSAYAATFGIRTVALRFSNVYGPGSLDKGTVVAEFFKRLLTSRGLEVYGDGSATRDFVHVMDIAQAIELALTIGPAGAVYQLGTGVGTSVADLIRLIADITDRKPTVRYRPPRSGELRATFSNISKARNELGFHVHFDLAKGLQDTWDWFRANYDVAEQA